MFRPRYPMKKEVMMEYDDSIISMRPARSMFYFDNRRWSNSKLVLERIRYAFETRLRWSPTQIRDYMTLEMLDFMKLKHLFKLIEFPPEFIPEEDLFYIGWALYPYTRHTSKDEIMLRPYKRCSRRRREGFPRNTSLASKEWSVRAIV